MASLRFWWRMNASNELGELVVAQIRSPGAGPTLCDVIIDFSTRRLTVETTSLGNVPVLLDAGASPDAGEMMLMECSVAGLGTTGGEIFLHLNGQRAVHANGIDVTWASLDTVAIGQPHSDDRRFIGTLDFDEVRVADRFQARGLWVDAGTRPVVLGRCSPVSWLMLVIPFSFRPGIRTSSGSPLSTPPWLRTEASMGEWPMEGIQTEASTGEWQTVVRTRTVGCSTRTRTRRTMQSAAHATQIRQPGCGSPPGCFSFVESLSCEGKPSREAPDALLGPALFAWVGVQQSPLPCFVFKFLSLR